MDHISDYTLWDLLTAADSELGSPCSVFDRSFLDPKVGVKQWLELRFVEKTALACAMHALLATALVNSSYSLICVVDASATFAKSAVLRVLREVYGIESDSLLRKVVVFPANSLEEMLLHVLAIHSFLLGRPKPALVCVDNCRAYMTDRDGPVRAFKRGQSSRSQLSERVYAELKAIKLACEVTLIVGAKETNPRHIAEISTPLNALRLWESVLQEDGCDECVDRRWYLLEGIPAAKYPDEVLFPIVQKGLTVAVVRSPWGTLLCEHIDVKTLVG